MTKRDFIRHCGLCAAGLAVCSLFGSVAWAQVQNLRLRSLGDARCYPGLQRRLSALGVARIEQAFDLANRKVEIEVTRL